MDVSYRTFFGFKKDPYGSDLDLEEILKTPELLAVKQRFDYTLRIGAMALVTVVAALSLKWSGLAGLAQDRFLLLMLIPAYARGAMLFGIRSLPYGRRAEGTGFDLFATPLTRRDFGGLVLVVALSGLLGWPAIWLNLVFILMVFLLLTYYRRKIGCITGDMLGAMTELTESGLFLCMAIEVLR